MSEKFLKFLKFDRDLWDFMDYQDLRKGIYIIEIIKETVMVNEIQGKYKKD